MRLHPQLSALIFTSSFFLAVLAQNLGNCSCLNIEGEALLRFRERVDRDPFGALSDWRVEDGTPCSWSGVGCFNGRVVILNLTNLCLEGKLAPELGTLRLIRFLILCNNSFSGIIPREIGKLNELEVLDLRYNNLSGPLPSELSGISSLEILLLDNNSFLGYMPPQLHDLSMRSKLLIGEYVSDAVLEASWSRRFITRYAGEQIESSANGRLLQSIYMTRPSRRQRDKTDISFSPSSAPSSSPSISLPPSGNKFLSPSPEPAPFVNPHSPAPAQPPILSSAPPSLSVPAPSSASSPQQSQGSTRNSRKSILMVTYSVISGVTVLFSIVALAVLFCRTKKGVTVRPWTTGLSGQLQKAFLTGVPSLKRAELEAACEDFSNIIGTSADSTLYKGTLSSGVEIAVVSSAVTSVRDWSKQAESQFRKKIDMLSKVNHKNFVNLLGYCEEEEPFTRMMVFEYAPNGTMFEHLHVKEAEHLGWVMRLRIMMGMAYCLEHMHQLNPSVIHNDLKSTAVYLMDDYAAKISDFSFWDKKATPKASLNSTESLDSSSDSSRNIRSFGLLLLEMMTGKLPDLDDEGLLIDWSLDYLKGVLPIEGMMDPTLKSFQEEEASAIGGVILDCINPDPSLRPTMREVTTRLRQITSIPPDGATPRLSPLWWAELEIASSEAS